MADQGFQIGDHNQQNNIYQPRGDLWTKAVLRSETQEVEPGKPVELRLRLYNPFPAPRVVDLHAIESLCQWPHSVELPARAAKFISGTFTVGRDKEGGTQVEQKEIEVRYGEDQVLVGVAKISLPVALRPDYACTSIRFERQGQDVIVTVKVANTGNVPLCLMVTATRGADGKHHDAQPPELVVACGAEATAKISIPVSDTDSEPDPKIRVFVHDGRVRKEVPQGPAWPAGEHFGPLLAGVIALVVVAFCIISAIVASSHDNGQTPAKSPSPARPENAPDAATSLKRYRGFWEEGDCRLISALGGQIVRQKCVFSADGVRLSRYCVQYTGRAAMDDAVARPRHFAWRSPWKRDDSSSSGEFIAYSLGDGTPAIWWEDGKVPVACFVHGPKGTDRKPLVAAFLDHGFTLTDPPSGT